MVLCAQFDPSCYRDNVEHLFHRVAPRISLYHFVLLRVEILEMACLQLRIEYKAAALAILGYPLQTACLIYVCLPASSSCFEHVPVSA